MGNWSYNRYKWSSCILLLTGSRAPPFEVVSTSQRPQGVADSESILVKLAGDLTGPHLNFGSFLGFSEIQVGPKYGQIWPHLFCSLQKLIGFQLETPPKWRLSNLKFGTRFFRVTLFLGGFWVTFSGVKTWASFGWATGHLEDAGR